MATKVQLTPAQEAKRQRIFEMQREFNRMAQWKYETEEVQHQALRQADLARELFDECGYVLEMDPEFFHRDK